MICTFCHEMYHSTNKLDPKKYVPSKEDLDKLPYVFDCISFRVQSLQSHCAQSNDAHLLAVDRTKNLAKEKSGQLSEAQEAVNSLRELERERLKYLFINVYSLMSKGRPYSEYEFYFEMDKAKGIDIGNTYKTRQDAMEFSYAITSIEVNKLRSLFYNSNFFFYNNR